MTRLERLMLWATCLASTINAVNFALYTSNQNRINEILLKIQAPRPVEPTPPRLRPIVPDFEAGLETLRT